MFDRIHITPSKTETQFVPYEKTVHEHRAPTDESIKLVREYEQKAIENLADVFKIENNILNGIVFKTYISPLDGNSTYLFQFKINGELFTIRHTAKEEMSKEQQLEEFEKYFCRETLIQLARLKLTN